MTSAATQASAPTPAVPAASVRHTTEAIAAWPRLAVVMDTDEIDWGVLWLPPGRTLEAEIRGGQPLEADLELRTPGDAQTCDEACELVDDAARVCVTRIACTYPCAQRYGPPPIFTQGVERWVREELGWGCLVDASGLAMVDVQARDTRDDSGECMWLEIAVEPALHDRIAPLLEQLARDRAELVDGLAEDIERHADKWGWSINGHDHAVECAHEFARREDLELTDAEAASVAAKIA